MYSKNKNNKKIHRTRKMTKINEQTIIKLDLRIIMLLIGLIAATVTSWVTLYTKVDINIKAIEKIAVIQTEHIINYQKMNNVVIKNNVQLENNAKTLNRLEKNIDYLVKKAEKE